MNWDTFWTAALCIAAIAFCAGIYREMVGDLSRRGKPWLPPRSLKRFQRGNCGAWDRSIASGPSPNGTGVHAKRSGHRRLPVGAPKQGSQGAELGDGHFSRSQRGDAIPRNCQSASVPASSSTRMTG